MIRYWIIGVAALAMMTGVGLAQDVSFTTSVPTQTVTQVPTAPQPPIVTNLDPGSAQRAIDGDGTVADTGASNSSGAPRVAETASTQTSAPEPIAPPQEDTLTNATTTTTGQ